MSQRLRDNPAECHLNRFRGGGFCSQEGDQICSLGPRGAKSGGGPAGWLCFSAGVSFGDSHLRPETELTSSHTHKKTL